MLSTVSVSIEDSSIECDRCGACCCTFPIFASNADSKREPRIEHESLKLHEWLGDENWRYQLHPLPFHDGCTFLDGTKLCSIYNSRPAVCRNFAAGSSQCSDARRAIGLPPLTSVSLGK